MDTPNERLRDSRVKAGFKSAAEAARHFGWNEAAYRHHENGTRGYNTDQAMKYGEAFKTPWYWLLDLGLGKSDSHRIALNKFYLEGLYPRLSWREGADETIEGARSKLGLELILELDIGVNSIDAADDGTDYPLFHLVNPITFGLTKERFEPGYLFMMRPLQSYARGSANAGDLLLVDSEVGEIKDRPQLWVARNIDSVFVCWAKRTPEGGSIILPDEVGREARPLDPDANIIGMVLWVGKSV